MLTRATCSNKLYRSHVMTLNSEINLIRAENEKLIMNYQCMIMVLIDSVGTTVMDIVIQLVLEIDAIVEH